MRTKRRVRWGPRPGHEKLQASLAKAEYGWSVPVLAFIGVLVFFGFAYSSYCNPYVVGGGKIGPPTSEASQRQWYGDPGR